jgi:predicted Ser/Thr protein kinase
MNGQEPNPNMEQKCPQCGANLPPGALGGLCPACLLKQGSAAETAIQGETVPFDPPKIEELAKLFPSLEILELIGKGGMGAVYKARQSALDRLVALKILPPQIAAGPGFAERFNREARALAKLNHPNIVGIYEFGQVSGLPYFMMEYVDGLNLRQVLRAGKLSPREALQIVPQICEALQFAHDEGIVHRDIKPENILLDKKGRVKIADFGIAKIMGREPHFDLTETKVAIGTPQYMAPEQIEKPQTVDHRADIFSLGVVFYEMLTGELPLGKFAPPSAGGGVRVDVRLDDVVLRALEKEPERRYQQASQVKTAVETISSTPPPRSEAESQALLESLSTADYSLSIQSCFRRAWQLLLGDFWKIVGVNAVIMLVLWAAGALTFSVGMPKAGGGSLLSLVLYGPLFGGLYLYFLRRIRGQPANIETAFGGFSARFVQLLLGGMVSLLLIALGLSCLVLPGVYLLVCWQFTLPLIMDKGMEFWPAMKLSRALVRKHWWKILGLVLVIAALYVLGVLLFGLGFFLTSPLATAILLYAYEDIFIGAAAAASANPLPCAAEAQRGPTGTTVTPVASRRRIPRPLLAGGIALALLVLLIALVGVGRHEHRRRHMAYAAEPMEEPQATPPASDSLASEAEAVAPGFGPVIEETVLEGINFKSGKLISLPETIQSGGEDISETVLATLRKAELIGIDAFVTDRGIGLYASGGTAFAPLPSTNWDTIAPNEIQPAITTASADEKPRVVMQMSSNEIATYAFQTRDLTQGILQILGTNAEPSGLRIRYKLAQDTRASPGSAHNEHDRLSQRLDAARMISGVTQKDQTLHSIAADAAKAGDVEVTRDAINNLMNLSQRDATSAVAAKLLANQGLRVEALQIASEINNISTRDQTLAELAR